MPKILPIVSYTNPILKLKSIPISNIDDSLIEFMDNMLETMLVSKGIGLAAPQVSRSIRLIIISDEKKNIFKMINPVIKNSKGSIVMREGCLSISGVFIPVSRPEKVEVEYIDEKGSQQIQKFSGLASRVIQHESDHLDGKLMIDFLDEEKKRWLLSNLKSLSLK
jgi:peptide deformylase